jgi:hypothetical protein
MSEKIEIHLDDARKVMYDELVEEFGEGMVRKECDQHIADVITELYDNIDELKQRQQQA